MSTLNQAFIKAYQRRGIGAPHLPSVPVSKEPPPEADTAPSAGVQYRSDQQQAKPVPPAHVITMAAASVVEARLIEPVPAEPKALADSLELLENMVEPAPIAADDVFSDVSVALDDTPAGLRPAYEVEQFEWPSIITSLLDTSDSPLAELMGELLPTGRGALLVTGCRRGEGRTSVALLIARHLAKAGSRVVLVDADFQRPRVAASLSTEIEAGWEETFSGAALGDVMIESLADGLVVLPVRQPVGRLELSAASDDIKSTLSQLQAEFEVVCIDGGPLIEVEGSGHDALLADAPIEAAVVVRDVRHSRLEQSHAVGRKLVQSGVSRWAIIENFV